MEQLEPFFSIVTVAYNSAATIEDTINSVLNQHCQDLEYIIVDGDSADNTLKIIKQYEPVFAERNISFRFISEPDSGIYDAMNKGIALTVGKWVGIINSDDCYEVDALEIVKKFIDTTDVELVHGNLRFIDQHNNARVSKPLADLNLMRNTMITFHPTIFIKRLVYKKFGSFDTTFRLCADWELILRLYCRQVKFGYIDAVIANFREGGAGSGFKYLHLKERFQIRNRYANHWPIWPNIKDLLIFAYFKFNPNKTSL